jgi:hypothetical protein
MNACQQQIRNRLDATGHAGKYDPRHIEAYIRLQYHTLNHLDRETFHNEIEIGRQCVDLAGAKSAEKCAASFGL